MILCKTPWLKPDYWGSDWVLPNEDLFLCGLDFEEYFDIFDHARIRLVAYARPSKDRYCIEFKVREDCPFLRDLVIDGVVYTGGFYMAFDQFLFKIYKRFGDRKLYVECEIK